MPFEIQLDEPPRGYALDASSSEGHPIRVAVQEFTSSEDGELFISRLEGFPQQLLSLLPPTYSVKPSMIDHLVAIIRKDLTATVYINECNIVGQMRAGRPIKAGEEIYEDDIVDIDRLSFESLNFAADAAVMCVFSSGWRKGFYFDITPLTSGGSNRAYEVEKLLGSCMAYLQNQQLFSLDKDDWDFLLKTGWFLSSLCQSKLYQVRLYNLPLCRRR